MVKKLNTINSNAINQPEDFGFIKIRVTTELGKFPLEGARVTIYASLDEVTPIETVTTDALGLTPVIQLPVAYNPEIEAMDPVYYYTIYHFSVSMNYYYPTAIYEIQVFPGITTEFEINMNPVPVIDPFPGREELIIPRIDL